MLAVQQAMILYIAPLVVGKPTLQMHNAKLITIAKYTTTHLTIFCTMAQLMPHKTLGIYLAEIYGTVL